MTDRTDESVRNAALEEAIAIIKARLPLYTEIGQINALRECIGSIRSQKTAPAPVPQAGASPMTIETELPAVKVKALEWRDGRTDETVFSVVQRATILGAEALLGLEYTILGPDRHGLFEVIFGDKIINYGNSEEQAKVVAQLDYERRIISALTLNGADVEAELLREALEFYADELTWADTNPKDDDRLTVLVPSPSFAEIDRGNRARAALTLKADPGNGGDGEAERCEPVAWRHTIVEPDGRKNIMLSQSAANPWSHWVGKHLGECVYACTPLYERSIHSALRNEGDR
ncbi:hypothetical protein [Rhizobium leguminosarum]|uniref:hypothetical protein n=1 Tax=Rhizobium leguminosarum TaxID=384 RepID=UPI001C957B8C|nr:hypothetical protein [Rhizobium leguminosarum]MBY5821434.1 hypothetical protein [Rhizobium leguminosarum]